MSLASGRSSVRTKKFYELYLEAGELLRILIESLQDLDFHIEAGKVRLFIDLPNETMSLELVETALTRDC